jgi:hypothetical protein
LFGCPAEDSFVARVAHPIAQVRGAIEAKCPVLLGGVEFIDDREITVHD